MYNYDNYDAVRERIEQRRQNAIAEAEARAVRVRGESEKIRQIDEELRGTGLRLFKAACNGEDIAPIRARNEALNKERRKELKRLGYPEDYTKVRYFCSECSDSGFINGTRMCKCFKEELVKERVAASGMGRLLDMQSFDNFDISWYNNDPEIFERMKMNLSLAKGYARDFAKNRGNMLLIGRTGTGKTHISSSIALEVIKQGFDVIYDSAQNIISDFESDKFRSGYSQSYEPKSEKYLECDLLIIDDLGTEFSSQFTVSCLYNLLNTRQNRGLATIISTNLTAKELAEKYEDRIYSRIIGAGCRVLVFEGRDRRIHC